MSGRIEPGKLSRVRWVFVATVIGFATPAMAQHLFTYTDESGHVFIVDNLNRVPPRYRKQIPQKQIDRWNEEMGIAPGGKKPGPAPAADPEPPAAAPESPGPASSFLSDIFDSAPEERAPSGDPKLLGEGEQEFLQQHFGVPEHVVREPEDPIGEPGLAGFVNDQFRPAGVLLLNDAERAQLDGLQAKWELPFYVLIGLGILGLLIYWGHAALNAHLGLMLLVTVLSFGAGNLVGILIGTVPLGGTVGTVVGLAPVVYYTWRHVRSLAWRYALILALVVTNALGLWMAIEVDGAIQPVFQSRGLVDAE